VISWDNKQAVGLEVELFEQRAQEVGDLGVLLGLAGLRRIASEEDEVDVAFFIDQRLQIAEPGIAQNTSPTPRLLLLRTLGVEVGNVQELQAILAVRHGWHSV
jgi:hypothetical protein